MSHTHEMVSDRINNLTITVNSLQVQLVDEEERVERRMDVVLKGIPALDNEINVKLMETFGEIAKYIQFDLERYSVNRIFRLKAVNKSNIHSNILVKFFSAESRTIFMSQYFKFKNLNLSNIGLASTDRIFCNENLTRRNYQLFSMARKLVKTHIHNVFSNDSLIYYRLSQAKKPIKITDVSQINKLQSSTIPKAGEPISSTMMLDDTITEVPTLNKSTAPSTESLLCSKQPDNTTMPSSASNENPSSVANSNEKPISKTY